jgi:heterodisulfide reductase subunit B
MVPCYIDMFYPQVGVATIELLEKLGIEADYPFDQTCCGQPMANSGAFTQAKATEELLVKSTRCRTSDITWCCSRRAPRATARRCTGRETRTSTTRSSPTSSTRTVLGTW